MKPPRLNPQSPDFNDQLQHHLDLIWQELEKARGIGGKIVRMYGPLDLGGMPLLNAHTALHHGTHEDGGADEISVAGLSGLLADSQTPLSHGNEKHSSPFVLHSLATAINDFLVASGAGTFVKKTLAETQALIGGSTFNDAEGDPAGVTDGAPADGTSVNVARRDHQHGLTTALGHRINFLDENGYVYGATEPDIVQSLLQFMVESNSRLSDLEGGSNLDGGAPDTDYNQVSPTDGGSP